MFNNKNSVLLYMGQKRQKRKRTTLDRGARVLIRASGNILIVGPFIKPVSKALVDVTGALFTTAGKLTDAELMATGHLAKRGLNIGIPTRSKTRRRRRKHGRGTRKRRRRGTRKGRRRKRNPAGTRLAYDALLRRSRRRRRRRRK